MCEEGAREVDVIGGEAAEPFAARFGVGGGVAGVVGEASRYVRAAVGVVRETYGVGGGGGGGYAEK